MSDFIPRLDRNSILCRDGSSRRKYIRDDKTGIWFWKAEESLNYKMKKKNKAADITGRESRRVLMLAAKNNWFQRCEKEGIWRRVPFPCWSKAATSEVISVVLPCITPFKKWLSSFLSLATFTTVEGSVCLVIAGTKFGLLQEMWALLIDQTRGGVGSLSLFGLGVVFCACRFSGSRVLYPIQLNRIKWNPQSLFVCFFLI